MKRRHFFTAVSVPAVGLVGSQGFGQELEIEAGPADQTTREIDILPFSDGVVYRENDSELAIPMIHPVASFGKARTTRSASAELDLVEDPPTFPMMPLAEGEAERVVAFNFFLPEADDRYLFAPREDQSQPLVLLPDPSQIAASKDPVRASNTSDGTIRQKWDKQIFRFEAHGIIRKDLNPTCVVGAKEGIWIKLDLPGIDSLNPFEWDRWHTFAEGTLATIEGKPGTYQFHWTKPTICSTGTSERNAVYNGVRKMIQDLVKEVLGSIGKYLDELLRLSNTIAAFIADTLTKWIRSKPPVIVQPPTQSASFTLTANPNSASVRRGSSVSYRIQVGAVNGFNGRVGLTAQGNTGSSVSFSPSSVGAGGQSTFTVRTSRTSRVGNHTITISGTSGALKQQIPVTINIQT